MAHVDFVRFFLLLRFQYHQRTDSVCHGSGTGETASGTDGDTGGCAGQVGIVYADLFSRNAGHVDFVRFFLLLRFHILSPFQSVPIKPDGIHLPGHPAVPKPGRNRE